MRGGYLLTSTEPAVVGNIYADKSALILAWLLSEGVDKESFSLREVAKEVGVSVGRAQKVFATLVSTGLLQAEGVRTAKRFFFKKPHLLLKSWLAHYSIVKKCKMWTYRSGFQEKAELLSALKKANLNEQVALALHSAAEAHGYKNTNLSTLELYMLDPAMRSRLEHALQLEPQEKGYEVLLIEPYYKSLLNLNISPKTLNASSPLLTFLDLYHFPLRGHEQAEFLAARVPELKRLQKHTQMR